MAHLLLFLIMVVWPIVIIAQKTVTATYTYYVPDNMSINDAKRTALDRAKEQCIANYFGTTITQENSTVIKNENGQSKISLLSLGGSSAKGEWVETIGEPNYNIRYEQNMLIVSVSVKGKIKKISQIHYNLDIKVLCNGTTAKYENNHFKEGDDMYVSFKSPVDGFLSIYLLNEKDLNVYCLLPYRNCTSGSWAVTHDKEYLLFSSCNGDSNTDEYTLTCSDKKEYNQLIFLFSPHEYAKAQTSDNSISLPKLLSYDNFLKWLAKLKRNDGSLEIIKKEIVIIGK